MAVWRTISNRRRKTTFDIHNLSLANFRPARGIRFKLVLFALTLTAATTFGVAFLVTRTMDQVLLDSLIKRGSAIAQAAAIPAGYSILIDDRLALDNLAARIKQDQDEILFVAILDRQQKILAHNQLDRVNQNLPIANGTNVVQSADTVVTKGLYEDSALYEFRRPIYFADRQVGTVVIGINSLQLVTATSDARRYILLIAGAGTLIALLCVLPLSAILTRPIKRLSKGVTRLQEGQQVDAIPVQARDELGLLTLRFNRMVNTIQRQRASLHVSATELESSYNDMVRILAAALDARDNYTFGHSARVARLALGLAKKMDLDKASCQDLELGCLLHDIGKIHVPDAILNKKGKLDDREHQQISKHPLHGSEILELAPSLHKYIATVKHHHERYDGSGYPDRLKGDAIPLHAQIVMLADTYDAMTSSRPYRSGLSRAVAVEEIRRCSGSQFNPKLVEPFIEVVFSFPEEVSDDIFRPEFLCAS